MAEEINSKLTNKTTMCGDKRRIKFWAVYLISSHLFLLASRSLEIYLPVKIRDSFDPALWFDTSNASIIPACQSANSVGTFSSVPRDPPETLHGGQMPNFFLSPYPSVLRPPPLAVRAWAHQFLMSVLIALSFISGKAKRISGFRPPSHP